jgi:surface protein
MNIKNLFCVIISLVLLWSCGKDDSPEPAKNNAPKVEAQSFTVAEDIMDRDGIGKVIATDKDNDDLYFSITENDEGLFSLSSEGNLTLSKGKTLDYESVTEHTITISVTDKVDTIDVQIKIKVLNVDNTLAEDENSFITLWNITEENPDIIIGTNISNFNYDYIIDWGDGTVQDIDHNGSISHLYEEIGTYKVAIKGQFPQIVMGRETIYSWDKQALIGIEQWGTTTWESFKSAFAGCENLENHAKDLPDLSQVTSMENMFAGTEKFKGDLSAWNVSNVINMKGMFFHTTFRGNISEWDVGNVKDMSYMFHNSTFNGDISKWDVGNVTDMHLMFFGNFAFNVDIGSWDVSQVKDMSQMFFEAKSFNGSIGQWNVGNVTNFASMLANASSFNQNLGLWNIENAQKMESMLSKTKLSIDNYEKTLIGWKNNENISLNIDVGVSGLKYCLESEAATARETLTNDFDWTFNGDEGIDCN